MFISWSHDAGTAAYGQVCVQHIVILMRILEGTVLRKVCSRYIMTKRIDNKWEAPQWVL